MPRASETQPRRAPLFFGLRPRLLGALALTAIVTLGVAALALLAPLQSALRSDSEGIARSEVNGYKTALGFLAVDKKGMPIKRGKPGLYAALDALSHRHGGTLVVWSVNKGLLTLLRTTDRDSADPIPPPPVREALTPQGIKLDPTSLSDNVLVVATRYRGQGYDGRRGTVLRARGDQARRLRRHRQRRGGTAFLYAALVGLAVALILGVALSSRLLRRLQLLRDATRRLDEPDLTTMVVPQDTVSDEIGELAHAFATMHERLRIQEDARRAFVSTASHELRTPIASLDGMLELLADDLAVDPIDLVDARERVARARLQSRRLASLASDLLDLSRLDARLDLRSEPVELGEAARAVSAEFDLRAHGRDVAVVLDEIERPSWAQADPGSVARIIRILLDNALRSRAAAHEGRGARAQRRRAADDRGRRPGGRRAAGRARADLRTLPARQRARPRGRLRPRTGDRL